MNKKVLFLVNHDIVIYNFRKELVERLLSEGYDVYISSPYGERIEDLIKMGCHYIDTKVDRHGINPIKDLFLIKFYKKIIKQINPKVVLTYTIKPNIYGGIAAKRYNIPYIANITGLGTAVEKKGILQFITILMYKYAFQKIQTVFLQNQENLDFFKKKKIAKDKLKLLPGSGVNLKEYSFHKYPQNNNKTIFVYIGRIMKSKGVDELFEVATIINKKYKNIDFNIIGFLEENYQETIKYLTHKGIINYLGFLKDVKPYIEQSNAIILPSHHEGMANVLLEAGAMGRPILASNIHGCKETFIHNYSGFGFEKQDANSLESSIEKFISISYMEKLQMGMNSRLHIEKNFDRTIIVNEYLKLINKI